LIRETDRQTDRTEESRKKERERERKKGKKDRRYYNKVSLGQLVKFQCRMYIR
jgi:hypothetical protein